MSAWWISLHGLSTGRENPVFFIFWKKLASCRFTEKEHLYPNRTITGKFAAPIIILINDRERKQYYEGELLFDDYIMRTITCNGHTITLQVSALGRQENTTWSEDFVFTSGETAKELTRREFIDHGFGEDAWWDEVSYTFLTFTLTIDGLKVINNEKYTSKNTADLYYDQVQMNGREFSVNGKVYKLQVNRDLY